MAKLGRDTLFPKKGKTIKLIKILTLLFLIGKEGESKVIKPHPWIQVEAIADGPGVLEVIL